MAAVEELSDYPPPGMEVRLIERFVQLKGKRILEVGCGDGRLTIQYAPEAASVVAIDPDPESISAARQAATDAGIRNVSFKVGLAERSRIVGGPFEVALFSWSL
jgi:ubiquinone/menaquinone biosynthesis C-methylase UbiE